MDRVYFKVVSMLGTTRAVIRIRTSAEVIKYMDNYHSGQCDVYSHGHSGLHVIYSHGHSGLYGVYNHGHLGLHGV